MGSQRLQKITTPSQHFGWLAKFLKQSCCNHLLFEKKESISLKKEFIHVQFKMQRDQRHFIPYFRGTTQNSSLYYNPNQRSHQQNFENNMISNFTSSTASNDVAPPPYSTSFSSSSQKHLSIAQPSSSGGAHMYAGPSPYPQAQHHMDTPSTSQLQRTINRTLLGGNESTLLSDQQPQQSFYTSPARETTIC